MAEVNRCPQCGCDMPPDSPAGLCPDCLLGAGLAASDPLEAAQPVTQARPNAGFVPPKPHKLADRFPQFEILDLLGYGGMGAVYKARQKSLDRLVALKIIKPDAVDAPGFAERFDREAKALAKLSHSNIVSIHDSGKSDGLYYFVMEYVDGTNLRRLIESKELAPEQAIRIIPQVCEALQFAHDEGIVHRDIKPDNILVDSKGRVKIADFGLAKLLGKTSINEHTLTGTHQVMGTPRYMAPEQMEGSKAVDHRADIYSLGVVFYEMLTGELPMGNFEPPSRKVQVDVRLDEIVLRSMAREPERRYQHASDVKTDVESISHGVAVAEVARLPKNLPAPVGSVATSASCEETAQHSGLLTSVLLILFFGAVMGFGAMIAPWSQVQIRGWEGGSNYNVEAEGYRYGLPIVGAMMSLVLFTFSLVKTIIGEFPSATRAILAAATGMTLALTGALMFVLAPLPNLPEEYSTMLRQAGHHFTDSKYSMRELQILEVQGKLNLAVKMVDPGYVMSILCGVALIVASVLEMRTVIVSQVERAGSDAAELLGGPASALRWAAWSSPLMIPVLGALNASDVGWRSGLSTLLLVMLVLQVLHALLILPLILIGISRMEAFLSRRLATAVCILSMLPLGLSFVFGLSAGIWALIVLARPEVERAFLERRVEPHIVAQQLRRAGSWLFITGLIGLVLWIVAFGIGTLLFVYNVRQGSDMDLATLLFALTEVELPVTFWPFVIVAPVAITLSLCQVLCAWRMARLKSRASGFTAAVIALIPFSPVWLVGLPLGVWSLTVLLQEGAKEAFTANKQPPKKLQSLDPPRTWLDVVFSDFVVGLGIIGALLALIGFAMSWTGSAWVLIALAVPWFIVGCAGAIGDLERAAGYVALFAFFVSVALIGYGISLADSAWPLAAIAPAVVAAIAGIGIGSAFQGETRTKTEDEEAENTDTQQPTEDTSEEDEKEESPQEKLEWAAWWIGMIGAARSYALLSSGGKMFDKVVAGDMSFVNHESLLQLTGPVMVIAAIASYHARSYALAIVGAVLCLPTGNCVPVILGISSLTTLFDPKVRALFLGDEAILSAELLVPAKPPMPRGYGDAIGSTLSNAWTEWWRERDAMFTRVVQTMIMLLHIGCLLAFLGFSAGRVTNDEGQSVFTHNIGFPAPWFTIETTSGGNEFSFNHEIHWTTSAWVVVGLGLGLAYIYCRIEKVRNPDVTFWHKPEAFMLVWGILALADVGLGAGMGQLAMNMNRQVKTTPPQVVETDETKADVSEADNNPTRERGSDETEDTSLTQRVTIDPQVAALLEAVSQGNPGRVKAQLDAGASVNAKDAEGRTLLMQAIATGHRSLALTLVVLGADLTEQDERGRSALMHAVEARDSGFISRLRDLQKIASKAEAEERKAELRAFSGVERTLLEGRDFDLRNVDLYELERQADENGETASLLAAREGDWEMFSQVSSTSDSLRARDKLGRTIAMHAAIHGRPEWFEFLSRPAYFGVAGKVNVYIGGLVPLNVDQLALTDIDGKTALQLAEENGHAEIADILRRHLQAIVDNQTAEIDNGGDDVAEHQELRRQAWRALGVTEKAKEDLDKANEKME